MSKPHNTGLDALSVLGQPAIKITFGGQGIGQKPVCVACELSEPASKMLWDAFNNVLWC